MGWVGRGGVLGALCALAACSPAAAATFTVDRFDDVTDGTPGNGVCAASGGGCSLRAAIQEANALGGADAIVLRSGTVSQLSIAPGGPNGAESGDLNITAPLSISASGSSLAVIRGAGDDRVLDVAGPGAVSLSRLTIANGRVSDGAGGGIRVRGGAALNAERLVVTGNSVAVTSGSSFGGGIAVTDSSSLTLAETALTGNSADGVGGGLALAGSAEGTVERSQISGNGGQGGAGVSMSSTKSLTIRNSTIASNAVQAGGGAGVSQTGGTVTIEHATIAGNTGSTSQGVRSEGGTTRLRGTILRGTSMGVCFAAPPGSIESDGANVADGTCPQLVAAGDKLNADAKLGLLVDNGGPTLTMALGAGSAALDAAGGCGLARDQRGGVRPQGTACDAGAFEAGALADLEVVSLVPAVASVVAGGEFAVQATVRNNGPDAATASTLTLAVPPGAAFVSGGSCAAAGGGVTCALGAIGAGGSATAGITLRATAPGTLALTAQAANAAQGDLNSANDQASASLAVTAAGVGPSASGPTPAPVRLRMLGLRASPTTFRVPRAARRRPAGTVIRFSLTLSARVTITVSRRSGKRWKTVATHARERRAGLNAVRFTDIVRRRAIVPGRYRIVVRVRRGTQTLPAGAVQVRVRPARR